MFATYEEALNWIHSRLRFGIKPGLKRMEWMLEKLGYPEKKLKAVHVGGTNGKGSTVAYLRSVLVEGGYEVGTFTSPYIEQFNERISFNGMPISDKEITQLVNIIKPLADELERTELGSPTEFEVITAMAFYYFAEMNPVDIAIFEVGLGGRFDSTNVIEPLASIITNVGKDHTQILGDTLSEIAYEKAGIIKRKTPVFTAVKSEEALAVIRKEVLEKESELYELGIDFQIIDYHSQNLTEQFTYKSQLKTIEKLELSLLGRHQTENAAGAVSVILWLNDNGHINISEANLRAGLRKAGWPGRMELLTTDPPILIDGAHNPEGMKAFAETISSKFQGKKIKIVFAALKDKDLTEMFSILNDIEAQLYLTEFDFPRAASAAELKSISHNNVAIFHSEWQTLITELTETLKRDELLAITGSLYFIALIRSFLVNQLNENDGN